MEKSIDKTVNKSNSMSDDNVRSTAKELFKDGMNGRMENIINRASLDIVRDLVYRKYGEDKYLKGNPKEEQDRRDDDYEKS